MNEPNPCGSSNVFSVGGRIYSCSTVRSGYYSTGGGVSTRTWKEACPAGSYCQNGVKYNRPPCPNSGMSSANPCGSNSLFSPGGANVLACTAVQAGYYSTGGDSTTRTGAVPRGSHLRRWRTASPFIARDSRVQLTDSSLCCLVGARVVLHFCRT